MRTVHYISNKAIYTFGNQSVKRETDFYAATVVRNVLKGPETTQSQFIDVGDKEITALCEAFGVPWLAIEHVTAGAAFLVDGRVAADVKGQEGKGYFWSRNMEIARDLAKVQLTLNAIPGIPEGDDMDIDKLTNELLTKLPPAVVKQLGADLSKA